MSSTSALQAVVLIHGMGEQRPMDTIKGFVRTVWQGNPALATSDLPNPTKVWSKPDDRTGSLELRRLTTRESVASESFPDGVRTDFYELYWADLTGGSTWQQFTGWIRYLLFRPTSKVPSRVRSAWVALWVASLLVSIAALLVLIPEARWKAHAPGWLPQKLVLAISAAAGAILHRIATQTFGRVVRYTRADPDNIAARKEVRERGLELLRAIHADGTYARVVIVGHSLGTILAHDLVSYFWAEQSAARTIEPGTPSFEAVCSLEKVAAVLEREVGQHVDALRGEYRSVQRQLRRRLLERPVPAGNPRARWLITDLVTFGSPLAHAQVLLADDPMDLEQRIRARELPACPPFREDLDPLVFEQARDTGTLPVGDAPDTSHLMVYPEVGSTGRWVLHHAAPFAVVRWTNVFDTASLIFRGDVISGPVAGNFGAGIEDIDLALVDEPSRGFTHTRYWDPRQSRKRLEVLREAMNLLDD